MNKYDTNTEILQNILDHFSFINIYGKAGTGKTTLALQFISIFLSHHEKAQNVSVWVQASETFPKKRLKSLYLNDQGLLTFLFDHIFIIPKIHPPFDYYEQNKILAGISDGALRIPPKTRILVIDNISHHLRFELSQFHLINDKVAILDDFFDSTIIPLIFFCEYNKIILILIHEVSYDPTQDRTVMFNDQLFSRLNGLNIALQKDQFQKKYFIKFHTDTKSTSYEYLLRQKGINILPNT
ncbi:MAG: NB-ARC domain-containing protein [Promethearchaeati archaeon]